MTGVRTRHEMVDNEMSLNHNQSTFLECEGCLPWVDELGLFVVEWLLNQLGFTEFEDVGIVIVHLGWSVSVLQGDLCLSVNG